MWDAAAPGIIESAGGFPVSRRARDRFSHPSERQEDMSLSVAQMVARAKAKIQNLSPDQVANELQAGTSTLIDIREPPELEDTGIIPGALHAPRGMLEFYADPTSPYYRETFDPDRRIILACDSGARSALAVETLQRMGYRDVAHLDGGVNAWIAQGLPMERAP